LAANAPGDKLKAATWHRLIRPAAPFKMAGNDPT
jgi:hypothetical protein